MKLSLDKWIEREFDPAPTIRTARSWVKNRKIYPQPIKVGRTYYVDENAVFQDGTERQRLANRIPK
ncbi:excisionase [Burkholderia cenocepacia]|uniref:excisionase n=1 Tax=Burkholderia cenocepacia TaxID=95486 RepID=UPI002237723E|nr:excisionase [Burkholderia cenocepacia]MCW5141098.1 excisionase [Burkholderia cenocepacia]